MLPRILIIEDEPAIADTLLYALKTEGFAPEWCATGRAGLAALETAERAGRAFALVVLDVAHLLTSRERLVLEQAVAGATDHV